MKFIDSIGVVHGLGCNAQTIRTRCRYCRQKAFYFWCNHGSKVFFESLGPPWPKHDCDEYLQHLQAEALIIHEEYAKQLTVAQEKRKRLQQPIELALPGQSAVSEVGVVREPAAHVDPYKKFGVPKGGRLAAAFLGPLANGRYVQMTVHTGDLTVDQLKSYTFVLPERLAETLAVERDDLVTFTLIPKSLANNQVYWWCTAIGRPMPS